MNSKAADGAFLPLLLSLRPINRQTAELASVLNLISDPQIDGKQTNNLYPCILGYLETNLHATSFPIFMYFMVL